MTDSRLGSRRTTGLAVARGLTVLGLVADAAVHLHLAPGYQESAAQGIGAGNLFRLEALAALLAAGYVLLSGSRRAYAVAFVVAISALVAVVTYRYLDIPALGPVPAMYEPVWFLEKSLSAVAEAVAAASALHRLRAPASSAPRASRGARQGG